MIASIRIFEESWHAAKGNTRGACKVLTARYHAPGVCVYSAGPKDYIDSGLAGDFRNKVGPAT
jgi:hypothetical protein